MWRNLLWWLSLKIKIDTHFYCLIAVLDFLWVAAWDDFSTCLIRKFDTRRKLRWPLYFGVEVLLLKFCCTYPISCVSMVVVAIGFMHNKIWSTRRWKRLLLVKWKELLNYKYEIRRLIVIFRMVNCSWFFYLCPYCVRFLVFGRKGYHGLIHELKPISTLRL